MKINDKDIATVEGLHDMLIQDHDEPFSNPLLERTRELTQRMYKDMKTKQIEISLEKAREIYSQGNEVMNALLLKSFSKEELENLKCWRDLEKIEGWWISDNSQVSKLETEVIGLTHRNTWATKQQAEASLAMSQLSQLMKHVNGDWVADWSDSSYMKYSIIYIGNKIIADFSSKFQFFLSFPTQEIRDKFLENHRSLIEVAKPLL